MRITIDIDIVGTNGTGDDDQSTPSESEARYLVEKYLNAQGLRPIDTPRGWREAVIRVR